MAHFRLLYDLMTYGLGMTDGDAIKLGEVGGEDLVIYVGDVTDNTDSGYAPGSIALDTSDGALAICDSDGKWQLLAEA